MSKHFSSVLQVITSELDTDKEPTEKIQLCVSEDKQSVTLSAPPLSASCPIAASFSFDRVYAAHEDAKILYKCGAREIVNSTLLGYNGTVIALEATDPLVGSRPSASTSASEPPVHGIIRRASRQIFRCVGKSRKSGSAANLVVLCSYVAVAEEQAYDLLVGFSDLEGGVAANAVSLEATFPSLALPDGCVPSTARREARSPSRVLQLLTYGRQREKELEQWIQSQRYEGSNTNVAAARARNVRTHHNNFQLTVEYAHFGTMNAPVSGTLSFYRLSSPHSLAYRKEYTANNATRTSALSLLSLADLVSGLTSDAGSGDSESKFGSLYSQAVLTRLLRDAVGGNSKTILICYSPGTFDSLSCAEVCAALEMVSKARHIQNTPNKRDLAERALMAAYMKELRMQYQGTSHEKGGKREGGVEGEGNRVDGDTKNDEQGKGPCMTDVQACPDQEER